jgi:FkbM family methyltransferase
MASVKSPLRRAIKPLLFKAIGPKGYFWVLVYGKIRDIKKRLVEEPEMALLPKIISAGDDVLDIGANFGYYTVPLSKLVGAGHVYAFEPIPFTFNACDKIIKHFNCNNVQLLQKGVGAKDETLTFSVPLQACGALSAGQAHIEGRQNSGEGMHEVYSFKAHETFDCDVISIDTFLLPKLKKLSFIKMDIEGAELFALKGMVKTLATFKPTILMEIEPRFLKGFGISEDDLTHFFEATGYLPFKYDAARDKIQQFSNFFSGSNYIIIHKDNLSKLSEVIAA